MERASGDTATDGVSRKTIDILPARSSGLASRCDPAPIIDQDSVERPVNVYVGCAIESGLTIRHQLSIKIQSRDTR
jgi:hypothetical protein